ncbi:hypothetical protein SAMN05443429_10871 [Cruoricaptor ignavus]|uniref:ParB-like nuclease domain-containing protein n=1 Tax=Cruoricaptor ignavus TaxID=1118202 RepID=A0A1M6G5V8_9FLAO|nr:hypothetical protein [Cruoricaptor ignavus]SHJ05378.1 hypothetical protein SAMN05443429_10871 [Cruoricaptor ignavus]
MSRKIKISDLHQDDKNFNKHTERGMALLEKSIEKVGVIESITVSSDDKIISGNARHEVMGRKFDGVEPIVIETDGTRPVIFKRTDIQSDTKQFHEAALLANTVAKKNIDLDLSLIEEVAVEEYGIEIEELGVEQTVWDTDFNLDDYFDNKGGNEKPIDGEIREIVLQYDKETFESVSNVLAEISKRFSLENNKSASVLKLIEIYNDSRRSGES